MSKLSPRSEFIHEVYDILGMYASPELSLEHLMGALVGRPVMGGPERRVAVRDYLLGEGAVVGDYTAYWQDILAHAAALSNEAPLPLLDKWMADAYLFSQEALRTLYPQWEEGETIAEFTRRIVQAEQNDDE